MKHNLGTLKTALKSARGIAVNAELTRLVALRRPCPLQIYFGASREVAQVEYDNMWRGIPGARQPVTMFFAEVSLHQVLDLTDRATLKVLRVSPKELFKNWRRARHPTLTQLLGQAVNDLRKFSAIRYPSAAADGKAMANFVIFRDCVRSPDRVRILGPAKKPLQQWP